MSATALQLQLDVSKSESLNSCLKDTLRCRKKELLCWLKKQIAATLEEKEMRHQTIKTERDLLAWWYARRGARQKKNYFHNVLICT